MGGDNFASYGPGGHLKGVSWPGLCTHLADKFIQTKIGQKVDRQALAVIIRDLLDRLEDYRIKDSTLPATEWEMNIARGEAARAAKQLQIDSLKLASHIDKFIYTINDLRNEIAGRTCASVSLLEATYDVIVEDYALDLPLDFCPIWHPDLADERLRALALVLTDVAAIPLKPSKPGSMKNELLLKSLHACRSALAHTGTGWSKHGLNDPNVRAHADVEGLKRPAERFVVDMLTAAEIPFTFENLNSMWRDARVASVP